VDKPDYTLYTDWALVQIYILGDNPDNFNELMDEMKERGFNTKGINRDMSKLVKKWTEKKRKKKEQGEDNG